MTDSADGNVATILKDFGGDPQRAGDLAAYLGFEPVPNPEDRLAGALSGGLKQFLRGPSDGGFGVKELYRVGSCSADPAEAGLWIGVLSDWGFRSSDRDRSRRRITRALVEQVPDRRSLVLLVPPSTHRRDEAELVFPRTQVGSSNGAVTSIRAHLDLENPSRFHRDLLRGLRISPGANLLEVSRLWQHQFSVERVTTRFYQEYAAVRDRIAGALQAHNPDHPVVKSLSREEARAWATRQMGRVLFLWFLQAKRWLGEPGGMGSPTYLLNLWYRRGETPEGEYYRGILAPMFFDAMATGTSSSGQNPVLGFVPYLNGGLFRRSALEDRIDDAGGVSLPDEVFDPDADNEEGQQQTLLGLLSRYRFTTRESTPDDQSVDPDPELLGRVFENLYQGDERRSTGTYYTPREIVHFMCREALDGYLRDRTGVEQSTLDALRREAVGSRDESQPMPNVPVDALIDALETVKVCDPAVGSGAFLLGAIQEIVALRRGMLLSQRRYVEPEILYRSVSDWKRRIIENSLYGVDINPEAVEICRLRLWLSMVLDMDEPPAANSDWALPNLDFQIVAGDSLVDRVAGIALPGSWPPTEVMVGLELRQDVERLVSNMARRRQEFERTQRDPRRLRELRDLIARDQREIIRLRLAEELNLGHAYLESLEKSKKPARTSLNNARRFVERIRSLLDGVESEEFAERFALVQKPFLWPIAFPDVLRQGDHNAGFDIVLANPPYIRHEKLDAEDRNSYAEAFQEVFDSNADVLVYFYARALQILRPGGWLSFITSNKFMRAGYGERIREYLPASLRMHRVIDFGDLPLFEANRQAIAAYPAVLVGSRSHDTDGHAVTVADLAGPVRKELIDADLRVKAENVRGVLEDLGGLLVRAEVGGYPQVMLNADGWILEDPILVRLFERLMNHGKSLAALVEGRIYRGVTTGLNKAFVIDQDKRDELIEEDPRSAELIKPWLGGKDIRRWKAVWAGEYIIAIQNSGDATANNLWADASTERNARAIFRDAYPAIHDHLSYFERFRDEKGRERGLGLRDDRGRFWWELRACTYYHEFTLPKIVWPDITQDARFAHDSNESYLANTAYAMPTDKRWLLPIMNSELVTFLLCHSTNALRGGYLRLIYEYVTQVPIISPEKDARAELELLADEILSLEDSPKQVQAIEREIDSIVFHVYGLSAPERKLVLDWLGERREALGAAMPPEWRKLNSLRATAGAWRGSVDGDKLIEDIYASRLIDTRPEPRL